MLYSEFIEGTGCRDKECNYKIYKDLEVLYMNSDISKEKIYEYGKKLVDNSKSDEEIKAEQELKEKIAEVKKEIKEYNDNIKYYREKRDKYKAEKNKEGADYYNMIVKNYTAYKKMAKAQLSGLYFLKQF